MSAIRTNWEAVVPQLLPGMKIIVRRDGFEYTGRVTESYFSDQPNEACIVIDELTRKKWPGSEQAAYHPICTLYVDTLISIISDDSGGFWYFTLPRANHGMIFKK